MRSLEHYVRAFFVWVFVLCSFVSFAGQKEQVSEDSGIVERRTIDNATLKSADKDHIVRLYKDMLLHLNRWAAGELNKVEQEIISRDDKDIDTALISVFQEFMLDDAEHGRLSSLAGKRTVKKSELVLHLLARRGTDPAESFVSSQATNEYPVIRARVATSLGSSVLGDSEGDAALRRVLVLLSDSDPEVSYRSLMAFTTQLGHDPVPSMVFAQALISARQKTSEGVKVVNGSVDLADAFDRSIDVYKKRLTMRLTQSDDKERESIDRILKVLNREQGRQ